MPMRIALCKSNFYGPISGADETIVTYASRLHQAGHDVTVLLLFQPSRSDIFYRRLRSMGVPIVTIAKQSRLHNTLRRARLMIRGLRQTIHPQSARMPTSMDLMVKRRRHGRRSLSRAGARLLALQHLARCRQHFKKAGYSIAHVVTPDSGAEVLIRAAADSGTPVLYQELGTPYHMPELDGTYQRLARVTPRCARLAALSPTLARQWSKHLPHPADIMVQPLIVERPRAWAIPRRPDAQGPILGFAARLEAGKGPQVLVEAFAEMVRGGRTGLLRMAGSGALAASLKLQSRELGLNEQCEFTGAYDSRDGCSAFLSTLDIFVLPSFAEGTPNSVIEAMACGLPMIASDVGGVRDIVTPDVGLLVPAGNVSALAAAIGKLVDDPELRRRMGAAGRQRYETMYSPEAGLSGLLATYAAVHASARPSDARHD